MMNLRGILFGLLAIGGVLGLAGCMANMPPSTTTQQQKPTSVLFSPAPPSTLAVQASVTLVATAIYRVNPASLQLNTAVNWSVTCGSRGACGSFSASDEGGAIVYTAPTAIPSGNTVTITATSVADPSVFASITITIIGPQPIVVSFPAHMPATLQAGSTFQFSASIENDVTANPQVGWSVTCQGSDCGSFSPSATADGQVTTYTAPATVPSGGTVAITATSETDPSKSASATIAITAPGPALANGTYVFSLTGPDSFSGMPSFTAGAFTASNGKITGGEQDTVDYEPTSPVYSGQTNYRYEAYSNHYAITGGSYGSTADGNLAVTLQLTQYGTETLSGALAASGQGFVANLNGAPGSNGTLILQTSTAAPSGGYALTLSGGDQFNQYEVTMGGVLNFDGAGSISGKGSELDVLDSAVGANGLQPVGASTVSAPDSYGRVVVQVNPGVNAVFQPVQFAAYIASPKEMQLVETGVQQGLYGTPFEGVLGGTALGQGSATGQFSTASLANTSYVFGGNGGDTQGPLQAAGVLTFHSDGTLSGSISWNDRSGRQPSLPSTLTGDYTVDAAGRVLLTHLSTVQSFLYSMNWYLSGDGNALLFSSDPNDYFSGQALEQQSGTLGVSDFQGNYGLNATLYGSGSGQVSAGPLDLSGPLMVTASGGSAQLSGYADFGAGHADYALSGSVSSFANGILSGSLTGLDLSSPSAAGSVVIYQVSPSQGLLIETDGAHQTLGLLQQTQ
jgi:hypothetical protein